MKNLDLTLADLSIIHVLLSNKVKQIDEKTNETIQSSNGTNSDLILAEAKRLSEIRGTYMDIINKIENVY